jgi:hypothetical protein
MLRGKELVQQYNNIDTIHTTVLFEFEDTHTPA